MGSVCKNGMSSPTSGLMVALGKLVWGKDRGVLRMAGAEAENAERRGVTGARMGSVL